jgi:hypothetical protein
MKVFGSLSRAEARLQGGSPGPTTSQQRGSGFHRVLKNNFIHAPLFETTYRAATVRERNGLAFFGTLFQPAAGLLPGSDFLGKRLFAIHYNRFLWSRLG